MKPQKPLNNPVPRIPALVLPPLLPADWERIRKEYRAAFKGSDKPELPESSPLLRKR
jgi:hypothetical protein